MKLLPDTHVLLWTLANDARLPESARRLIEDEENDIYYSIISPWEVEIKRLLHPDQMTVTAEQLVEYCKKSGFYRLLVRESHVLNLGKLHRSKDEPSHKDPFDRMMICQALGEGMLLITHDRLLAGYNESCVMCV